MIPQPNLKTLRLILRPFSIADADPVAELLNDKVMTRNLRDVPWPYSLKDAQQWIGRLSGDWESGDAAVFAVFLLQQAESPRLVGAIGLVFEQPSNRAELGYWVGRDDWGQGIATEACVSVLDFAFSELGIQRVYGECLARNPASAAVLKKVGMSQEGVLANHFRKDETDEYCDVQVFGLLRSDWNDR